MKGQYFSSDFSQWLIQNTDLLSFIRIETYPDKENEEKKQRKIGEIEMRRQTLINRMVEYSQRGLNEITFIPMDKKPSFDSAWKAHKVYQTIKFLENEIYAERQKRIQIGKNLCEILIKALLSPSLIPPQIEIIVDESRFIEFITKDSSIILRLIGKRDILMSEFNGYLSKTGRINLLIPILKEAINQASMQIDEETLYFSPNRIQHKYDQILMSNMSPLKEIVSKFLDNFQSIPTNDFTNQVLNIFYQLNSIFEIRTTIEASVHSILFFRSIFNICYGMAPSYFYTQADSNIAEISKNIPLSYIEPPDNLLPDHKENATIFEVFKSDPIYSRSSNHILFAQFYTNPIDALFEIHEVMMLMQKGASIHAKERGIELGMLPFETSFGLFIGTIIASGVPHFEETANFISKFCPCSSLSPEFDYALASTTASIKFCKSLSLEFSKKENLC